MLNEVLPRWLAWHRQLVEHQVILSGGFAPEDAARFRWFKTDRVRILPFMVRPRCLADPS